MAVTCSGTIKDPSGQPIANLEIILRSVGTSATSLDGAEFRFTTANDGSYSFNLENGVYATFLNLGEEIFVGEFGISSKTQPNSLNGYLFNTDFASVFTEQSNLFEQFVKRTEAASSSAQLSSARAAASEQQALSSKQAAATSASEAKTSQQNAASSATNAGTSATNAAASARAASTSEGEAANSATAAANSATAAANSATAAKTSETNAAGSASAATASATAAANSATAAANSATAANRSATTASSQASTASTSASQASSSASAAAASAQAAAQSEQAAATSEAAASGSETAAASSESAAATSASNAHTSETHATASATAAANSATAAANSATAAHSSANVAKQNADKALHAGGIFTPTSAKPYPSTPTRPTAWIIGFPTASDTFTYSTGDLNTKSVANQDIIIYIPSVGHFQLVPNNTANTVTSVNGNTGAVTLFAQDVGALPSSATVNGVHLSSNPTFTASNTQVGMSRFATTQEIIAGALTSVAVSPAGLKGLTATTTRLGLSSKATQAQVNAGKDNSRFLTPLTFMTKLTAYSADYGKKNVNNTWSAVQSFESTVLARNVVINISHGVLSFNTDSNTSGPYRIMQVVQGLAVAWAMKLERNGDLNFLPSGSKVMRINGQKVWTAGNDGHGSGLDADLLDGEQGAFYRNANNMNAGVLNAHRVPASPANASAGQGFGGFRHTVTIEQGQHWLNLFTS